MKWFINRNWSINWIAAILAVYVPEYIEYDGSYTDFIARADIWGTFYIVVLGAGTASFGYGAALLAQKIFIMRDKFKEWFFLGISLPMTIGLTVLYIEFLYAWLTRV